MLDYQSLSEEEIRGAIEDIARWVVKMRLETPAIMLLELNRPVSFAASQALIAATPFLGPVFGLDAINKYGGILNNRDYIDQLIDRIDELASQRSNPAEGNAT